MTADEDAQWQDKLAGAINRAMPGAVVTFTTADEPCPSCGHQHAGDELAGICVGCACPGPADRESRQRDLDAAIAEVAMRAGEPADINRLVAAAVRLRQAYLRAGEPTRPIVT